MIDKKTHAAMVVMDSSIKDLCLEQTTELVEKGKKLVEKYGREWLDTKLIEKEDMRAASVLFVYELATNDDV